MAKKRPCTLTFVLYENVQKGGVRERKRVSSEAVPFTPAAYATLVSRAGRLSKGKLEGTITLDCVDNYVRLGDCHRQMCVMSVAGLYRDDYDPRTHARLAGRRRRKKR